MIKKLLVFLIFSSVFLFGQNFNCKHYAHINHDTGIKKTYTKSESMNMPPFNFIMNSNKIYVDLPSGNKEIFILKDVVNGERIFFSQNNYYLRQPSKYPDVWYWDMRLQGQLQTAILICKKN